MKRIYVSSTTMKSIGYDEDKKILEIKFIDDEIYQYYDVSIQIYEGLMNAESKGKYFNEVVKKENYKFKKLTE